jgi:pyridoxamine 5'-phosphate oxidase
MTSTPQIPATNGTHTADPFALFESWYGEARSAELNDSNAMALATVDSRGHPSVRMVLLKGFGPEGFVFYTNFQGRKAQEILTNPNVALLFHWKSLRRQVRIEGAASPVADDVADGYFASRSRDSQLGAWASEQSRPLDSRETFEQQFARVVERYEGRAVPRPPHWSGFRVQAAAIEFWLDREHRLHERTRYELDDAGGWRSGMLYP